MGKGSEAFHMIVFMSSTSVTRGPTSSSPFFPIFSPFLTRSPLYRLIHLALGFGGIFCFVLLVLVFRLLGFFCGCGCFVSLAVV